MSTANRDEILGWMPEALESIEMAFGQLQAVARCTRSPRSNTWATSLLYSSATVTPEGSLEFYDGVIRIVDAEAKYRGRRARPAPLCLLSRRGQRRVVLREVSLLQTARVSRGHVSRGTAGPPQRGSSRRVRRSRTANCENSSTRTEGAVCQSFHYHLARLIEMLHCIERIEELANDPELLREHVRAKAGQNRNHGVGSCEAPRGTLFHDYEVDDNGLMRKVNLLIATAQNNLAMNRAVEQTARHFISSRRLQEGMLNRVEAAVRCFDPCLSCSTHAAGQMPLIIELRDSLGRLLDRAQRG